MSSHETERKYTQSITLTPKKQNQKEESSFFAPQEKENTKSFLPQRKEEHKEHIVFFETQRKEELREMVGFINHREKENTESFFTTENAEVAEKWSFLYLPQRNRERRECEVKLHDIYDPMNE